MRVVQVTETDIWDEVIVKVFDALTTPHPLPNHECKAIIPEIAEETSTLVSEILDIGKLLRTELEERFLCSFGTISK